MGTGPGVLRASIIGLVPGGCHEPVPRSHPPLSSRLHGFLSNSGHLGQNTFQPCPRPLAISSGRSHFRRWPLFLRKAVIRHVPCPRRRIPLILKARCGAARSTELSGLSLPFRPCRLFSHAGRLTAAKLSSVRNCLTLSGILMSSRARVALPSESCRANTTRWMPTGRLMDVGLRDQR